MRIVRLNRRPSLRDIAIIFSLLSANSAYAANFDVTSDQTVQIASVTGDADFVFVNVPNNRSYCLTIQSRDSALVRFGTVGGTTSLVATNRGLLSPIVNRNGVASESTKARKCLLSPINSTARREILNFPIQVGAGVVTNGTATNITVMAESTSLVGGYNTSVTDFNFLEITASVSNTAGFELSSTTINGVLIVQDVVNNVTVQRDFSVVTNASTGVGRVDINIHELMGAGNFGPIVINHNGSPGSLTARTVQYNITSTSPLDFSPVLEQQFVPEGPRHP